MKANSFLHDPAIVMAVLAFFTFVPGRLEAGAGDITLGTFESGAGNWVANPDAASAINIATSNVGATEGASSLEVIVTGNSTGNQWTPTASIRWEDGTPESDWFEAAVADDPSKYLVEIDVSFDPASIDPATTWAQIAVVINSDQGFGGAYSLQEKLALHNAGDGAVTRTIQWPLSQWRLADRGFYEMILIYNGDVPGDREVTFYVDNIRIRETGGLEEQILFSFEDGTTQGWEAIDTVTYPDWNPVTSIGVSPANATDGSMSLRLVTPANGWTYGARLVNYSNPALDDALFLLADFTVPSSIPDFNQVIFVMFEPDTNLWQQLDIWIGGSSGQKTLAMPIKRTGTGPVEFFFGYASPSNPATVYMDNIRIIKVLPFVDPTPPAAFQVTDVTTDNILGEVNLSWNSEPKLNYSIWTASDLQSWVELEDAVTSQGESTSYSQSGVDFSATPMMYYQVRGPAMP